MATQGAEERSGREIRLLILVIIVAVAGLLVLARFRFPAADVVGVSPTPSPLERLAVRAPFDESGARRGDRRGACDAVHCVVEFEDVPAPPPAVVGNKGRSGPVAAPVPAAPAPRHLMPALRVRADRVLTYVPSGTRPVLFNGQAPHVLGADPRRELAVISAADSGDPSAPASAVVDFAGAAYDFSGSGYVIAVEAAAGGPSARPVYIPRLDPVTVDLWDQPLLRIGGRVEVSPGAMLFTLDGRLIGLTVPQEQGVAIVAPAALNRLAGELTSGGQ